MKEPKRRRSLSGAVLVMILTVMFVLIILLTATLTTVTTANQRIYTKFEENQAYYTARSALDVFTQNMLSDSKYIAQDSGNRSYQYGNSKSANMKQGLGMQLDLYSMKAQSGHNIEQSVVKKYWEKTGISGTDKAKDEYKNYFGTDSTKVQNNGKPSTDPDYKEFVTYEVSFPTISNGSNAYGKLSDSSTATIKVEVLERRYNLGTYTDGATEKTIPDADVDDFLSKTGSYTTVTDDMISEAIGKGNRKKDTMRVQITATTEYSGVEGVAVLILDSNEPPVNNSARAITAFGGATGINHAYIVGGMSMIGDPANPTTPISWTNESGIYGTVYCEAPLNINVASPIYLTEGEYFFLGGQLNSQNNTNITAKVTDTSLDKRPFVYVNGDLVVPGGGKITVGGAGNEAVDVIVKGNLDFSNGADFKCNGNVYVTGNCTLTSTAGTPNITGNMYVGGNVTVGSNCYGDSGIQIGTGAKLYTNGTIINKTSDGETVLEGAICNGNLVETFSAGDLKVPDLETEIKSKANDGKTTIDITLPNGVTKKVGTHKGNYDNYYYINEDGKYTNADGDLSTNPVAKSAVSLAGKDFTNSSNIPKEADGKEKELKDAVITAGIDTAGAEVAYVLYNGSYGGKTLRIKGGGTAELYLRYKSNPYYTPPTITVDIEQLNIVVDDDTTLKIYGSDPNTEYNLKGVSVWTAAMYEAKYNIDIDGDGTIQKKLNVGSAAGKGIKVPKVYYYFSGGKFNCSEIGSGSPFYAGYFFGPDTEIWSQKSKYTFDDMYYFGTETVSGAHVDTTWPFAFVGSILCKDYTFQNDQGVAYINPNLDDDTPGDPIHQWQSFQYIRG